jgi:hypothetical protein
MKQHQEGALFRKSEKGLGLSLIARMIELVQ